MEELIGRTFRPTFGGKPMVVVAEEEAIVYMKRADASKRQLAIPEGGYCVARSELVAEWEEVAVMRDS